jgi:hypothetical protein
MGDFVIDTFLPIAIVILVTIAIILGIYAILLTTDALVIIYDSKSKNKKSIKRKR